MHHYPASLIGSFSADETRAKRRTRPVWIARRGVPKPFLVAAEEGGFDPSDPQIYAAGDDMTDHQVDDTWSISEQTLLTCQGGLRAALAGEPFPASFFAQALVPLVSSLLVRHPLFPFEAGAGPGWGSTVVRAVPRDRIAVYWLVVELLLYCREWSVVVPPSGEEFISTDAGWQWLPGPGAGRLFAPLARDVGVIVGVGTPTYNHALDQCQLTVCHWDVESHAIVRSAMFHGAPRDVYASSQELAEGAIAAWAQSPPEVPGFGTGLSGPQFAAHLLLIGAAESADQAHAGFMKAVHRWGCACEAEARKQAPNRASLRLGLRRLHHHLSLSRF